MSQVESITGNTPENVQNNSWFSGILGGVLRMIFFQMVMKYFFSNKTPQITKNPLTGAIIPPLSNYINPNSKYDINVHLLLGIENRGIINLNELETKLIKLEDDVQMNDLKYPIVIELWNIKNLTYNNDQETLYKNISFTPPKELLENNGKAVLLMSLISHESDLRFTPNKAVELIELMPRFSYEDTYVSLLDDFSTNKNKNDNNYEINYEKELRYWKNKIDLRVIFDDKQYNIMQNNTPPLSMMLFDSNSNVYYPILYPSDFWCIEKNFSPLNSTLLNNKLNLTLSYTTMGLMKYTIQKQMIDAWNMQSQFGLGSTQKDIMMLKRIFIETNKYYLAFSTVFVLLHSTFQMLAFKNDISFWHNNESMYGLSTLSIFASFISELIIGLYLLDSNETSWILLVEIFVGIAISLWKLWKTKIFEFSPIYPYISFRKFNEDLQEDEEVEEIDNINNKDNKKKEKKEKKEKTTSETQDLTRKYDAIAIKYMSIILMPCMVGYAIYCLKYNKYRNWYSFIISVLAGTVYTFGFIMMTPQLYINYKLKSVDHLPWRYLIYKALNTFIDDIFSFIIDMPWMHRLACFRDDIIFIIYIYQRWIYSVDKTRGVKEPTSSNQAEKEQKIEELKEKTE